MYDIEIEELKHMGDDNVFADGYRIVYFYEDGHYYIGEYCKSIEGFMTGFADIDPIDDESDTPVFISNQDLLRRYLDLDNSIIKVSIYKIDGTIVDSIERDKTL